jgi:hypothetical protein
MANNKQIKSVQILTTADSATVDILKTDSKIELKSIDWNDASDRKWLANHLHWAMCSGKAIILKTTD